MAQGPFTRLPKPPRPSVIIEELRRGDLRETSAWFDRIFMILSGLPGIAWNVVSKTGSSLTDIVTRPHSALQTIRVVVLGSSDSTGDRHISDALGTLWEDHRNASTNVHGIGSGNAVVGTGTMQEISNKIFDGSNKYGGNVNYSEFEEDGTLVFNGEATVWEDLNFDPDSSGGPPPTLPDYVTINNVIHREFTSSNNQTCGSNKEMPHAFKLGRTLYPHLHVFLKNGESAGTTGVTFTLYWELRQSTGTTSGSVTLSATSATLNGNAHKVNIYDNTGFAGPAEKGANLAITIARTAGDAGDVIVTTYGVHYELDTVGSRAVDAK